MKKKLTQLRWLATMLMLVAAMVMPSAVWAQESTVTFTAKEGTVGFSNESFDKLIDGKFTSDDFTKWCLSFPSEGAYIIFSASERIQLTGYSIVTGNDNADSGNAGRNPKSWKLYGCNDESAGRGSESWVLIDEVTNDTKLEDLNYKRFDFTLSNPLSEKYQYFKMEITATKGAPVLQMSELILTYSTCNHQWVKTDDVVAPTCTEGGYDVYKCSVCQLTKKESNNVAALGHQWVSGTVVAPTCTKDGYTPQTCSRCQAEQKIDIVKATGHQWGKEDICDVCGADNSTLSKPQNGDGSADNPYQIGKAGELYWFAGLVNGDASVCTGDVSQNKSANAVLTANITVNKDVLNANGEPNGEGDAFRKWTPIGQSFSKAYSGTFDGQGHTISGLWHWLSTDDIGLFGNNEGTIKNLGVVDSYLNGHYCVGGVCGRNGGSLTNCYHTGPIYGYNYIGGVCGMNSGSLTNCYNTGNVRGNETVGGVCGGTNGGSLTNCYNTGPIYGDNYIGGVCGRNDGNHPNFTNCYYLTRTADCGIGNTEDIEGFTKAVASTQFTSGEVCHLLNSGKAFGSQAWGQQLGTDNYPVLGSEYKIIKSAKGDKDANNNDTYWATFSNLNSDATLLVPSARNLNVYNATVSSGTMTLKKRADNQVAKGEGVLLKTDGEYVNVKANETDGLTVETYANNNLVATSATEETINAETGYKLYRLTYNNSTDKTGLGFYLGLVKNAEGTVISDDGSQLKATPGKAYLKVSTGAATNTANAAPARGFVFSGDDETTAIDEIVIEGDAGISGSVNADGSIYNLQGQQVSAPTKGLYIKNNKKVIIK